MSNKQKQPEVGDVWENILTGQRVNIFYVDKKEIRAWMSFNNSIHLFDFYYEKFIKGMKYLGKSKANINDLFKTENEWWKNF